MSAYTPLAKAAGEALAPLADALDSPSACERLLRDLGYPAAITDAALGTVRTLLGVGEVLDGLPDRLAALDGSPAERATAVAALVEDVAMVVRAVRALQALDGGAISSLPGPLHDPEAWQDLAEALPDYLLSRWLAEQTPPLHLLLRLAGVIAIQSDGGARRERLSWDALGSALGNPGAAVRTTLGWGDHFAAWGVEREIGSALSYLGAPVQVRPRSPEVASAIAGVPVTAPPGLETGIVLLRGRSEGAAVEVGLVIAIDATAGGVVYVGNAVHGKLGDALDLGGGWSLTVAGELEGNATVGVLITPVGVALVGEEATLGASLTLASAFSPARVLAGEPDGTRLELDALTLTAGVDGSVDAPEAYLSARVADGALRLVLNLGAGDAFLRAAAGGDPVIRAGAELRWSSTGGLRLGGGVGFVVTQPLDVNAGPLHVSSLTLAAGDGARLAATAVADLAIGPVVATITDVGAALVLAADPDGDGLGGLSAALAFVPPTGIGLGVDADGVVTGGGFVRFQPGRYSGLAQLEMLGTGLTVMGILETDPPDEPDGWSLFLSVIVDLTPVPLGFGFTLTGVGGFMGINRTLDDVELADGVREGRVESIMFPEDPLRDAARILEDAAAYFPSQSGQHTFGAMIRIAWGSPALITGELGVILSVPEVKVAAIGELSSVLPNEDLALIELHMGVAGVIDVAEGTLTVTASIHDSRLVGQTLSGDMAAYLATGSAPYFLLAVGGFHPKFKPPAAVPASLRGLQRMTAAIDLGDPLRIALDAYVAVTPNTLQFGAGLSATARAAAIGVDFTAEGWFSFDVLLRLSPLRLRADMTAGVTVRAEGETLVAVQLDLHVEGPEPWYGSGRATFTFLGIEVPFRVQAGGAAPDEPPGSVAVRPLLDAAFADPGAWAAAVDSTGALADVALRPLVPVTEAGLLWLDAGGAVEVRQSVVPLGFQLDTYGDLEIKGDNRFDIAEAGVADGVSGDWATLQDWFAPAEFETMTDSERLGAPSFELMDAGVSLTGPGFAVPGDDTDAASVAAVYEEYVIDDAPATPVAKPLPAGRLGLGPVARTVAARRPATRFAVDAPAVGLDPARFCVVDALDAAPVVPGALRYCDALRLRRDARVGPARRPRLVPESSLSAPSGPGTASPAARPPTAGERIGRRR